LTLDFGFLNLGDVTDRLTRNAGKKLHCIISQKSADPLKRVLSIYIVLKATFRKSDYPASNDLMTVDGELLVSWKEGFVT